MSFRKGGQHTKKNSQKRWPVNYQQQKKKNNKDFDQETVQGGI